MIKGLFIKLGAIIIAALMIGVAGNTGLLAMEEMKAYVILHGIFNFRMAAQAFLIRHTLTHIVAL